MPTISLASSKGGAGKSTTAVVLATELAARGAIGAEGFGLQRVEHLQQARGQFGVAAVAAGQRLAFGDEFASQIGP